jgi:hypothetical protein
MNVASILVHIDNSLVTREIALRMGENHQTGRPAARDQERDTSLGAPFLAEVAGNGRFLRLSHQI